MGSQRVGYNWAFEQQLALHLFLNFYWSVADLQCCYHLPYSEVGQLHMHALFLRSLCPCRPWPPPADLWRDPPVSCMRELSGRAVQKGKQVYGQRRNPQTWAVTPPAGGRRSSYQQPAWWVIKTRRMVGRWWLGLGAFTAMGWGSIPGRERRSLKLPGVVKNKEKINSA